MSDQYDNNMTGVLFRNDRKENERQPDHTGNCEVNGVQYWLSAWIKESKTTGKKFFSLSFREKDPLPGPTDTSSTNTGYGPKDSDIPF